ncbi:MAG: hypothetical protein H6633_35535 [Anaerolineales bacterium]|nr:hypothetical protein [Anaerolineales bacterium]
MRSGTGQARRPHRPGLSGHLSQDESRILTRSDRATCSNLPIEPEE